MAETEEGLSMTAKERDRLKVLHEVKQRHMTQNQAAKELSLSVRWVRELLRRWRTRGDGALRHGPRGRTSNRKTSEAVKQRTLGLYREQKQAKLWRRRRARLEQAHVWRAQRARYVQWDTVNTTGWKDGA
jgi:transposase